MRTELVIPRGTWDRILGYGLRQGREEEVLLSSHLGIAHSRENVSFLLRGIPLPALPSLVENPQSEKRRLLVCIGDDPTRGSEHYQDLLVRGPAPFQVLVVLGRGRAEGYLGAWRSAPDGGFFPVDGIFIPGAGMHRLLPAPSAPAGRSEAVPERWSRTVGVLGEGAWRRLTSLHYAVIGTGRLGSTLAFSLARMGVRRLTLVDSDLVEEHNLGESEGFRQIDVGSPKVDSLALSLQLSFPWLSVHAIGLPVSRYASIAALKGCDLLFCCADSDGGRLATGILAASYLKVLIDVGTGVVLGEEGRRVRGIETRLVVPGDGCLGCLGGVGDEARAREQLSSVEAENADLARTDFHRERPGSLRSLNQMAVGLAAGMLERLVAEEDRRSQWMQMEWAGEDVSPVVTRREPRFSPGRCICSLTGQGEENNSTHMRTGRWR